MSSKKSQTFNVKIKDRKNNIKDVEVKARSIHEANQAALMHGGSVVQVKKKFTFGSRYTLSSSERFIFLNRLSTMVSSNMGLAESLIMMRDTFTGKIRNVSSSLCKSIERGLDLDAAMEELGGKAFPSSIVALIRAGMQGGNTGKALLDAALFEQELNDIKKESSKGMVSAVLGFMCAGAFLIGSSFYMSPKVKNSPMFQDMPSDTSTVDLLANVLGGVMVVIMVLFISLMLLSSVIKGISPAFADKIILKIPFYRDLVLAKNSYAMLYGFSMLVKSGVRISDSLKLTMENAPRGSLRNNMQNAWEAVNKGDEKWAGQMKMLHPTDRAALMTSSDRDQIAETLNNLSGQYRRLYGERLKVIIPTMQLISAALLSVTGAIMFAQIILPMLQLTQKLA